MKVVSLNGLMTAKPWYHEGLRFRCLGCGRCCTGEPGYVWVTAAEIALLAAALQVDVSSFENAFVRAVGKRRSLVELPNGDCIFFDSNARRCTAYDCRPAQCRTWPFWESNVSSRKAWEETCRACPGSGRGTRIAPEQIGHLTSVVRL